MNPLSQEELKNKIMACDAILLSGPVYFGDRGSLAQSFLDYCSENTEISAHLKGKIYGGIAVGAKRFDYLCVKNPGAGLARKPPQITTDERYLKIHSNS